MRHIPGMDGLGQRMREAVDASGLSLAAVASGLQISVRTLHNYFNDEREPNLERLHDFADITGARISELVRRDEGETVDLAEDAATDSAFVMINCIDVELSAGPGKNAGLEPVIGQFAFRKDWLKRMGLLATKASLVKISGDSMEPTLLDGSMVLIDHRNQTPVTKSSVFACRLGDELKVKRVERSLEDQSIFLHSDNTAWPTQHISRPETADFEIIGRVVWSARTWPD